MSKEGLQKVVDSESGNQTERDQVWANRQALCGAGLGFGGWVLLSASCAFARILSAMLPAICIGGEACWAASPGHAVLWCVHGIMQGAGASGFSLSWKCHYALHDDLCPGTSSSGTLGIGWRHRLEIKPLTQNVGGLD